MGLFSTVKKAAGNVFDFRVDKWVGWDYIVDTTEDYKNVVKNMATPAQPEMAETFEEAIQRLGLTETDLADRKKEFTRLFVFFIVLSLLIIGYGLYMAIQGNMISSLIAFCISIYSLSQAFRFHFWLFQIKYRKLGCTLKEWMNGKPFDPMATSAKKEMTPQPTQSKDEDPK